MGGELDKRVLHKGATGNLRYDVEDMIRKLAGLIALCNEGISCRWQVSTPEEHSRL
jgi:hypothetical protein